MEATSIYHERLAKSLFDAGYQVCVTNPARARYFAQSMSKLNKTDKASSEVLARFAMNADLHFWQPLYILVDEGVLEKDNILNIRHLKNMYSLKQVKIFYQFCL